MTYATSEESLDDLLGKSWEVAYYEGSTGNSRGDDANDVLFAIKGKFKELEEYKYMYEQLEK